MSKAILISLLSLVLAGCTAPPIENAASAKNTEPPATETSFEWYLQLVFENTVGRDASMKVVMKDAECGPADVLSDRCTVLRSLLQSRYDRDAENRTLGYVETWARANRTTLLLTYDSTDLGNVRNPYTYSGEVRPFDRRVSLTVGLSDAGMNIHASGAAVTEKWQREATS